MKKLSLLLIFVLCLGCLAACGANSSAENAAETYIAAQYVDYDAEDYYSVMLMYAEDIIDLIEDDDDREEALEVYDDKIEEAIEDKQDELDEDAEDDEADEIYYSVDDVKVMRSIDSDHDDFDSYQDSFKSLGIDKDYLEEIAVVRVDLEVEEEGDTYITAKTVTVAKIDGSWYVWPF